MTDKQISAIKHRLNEKYYGDEPHLPEYLKQPWSKEDEILEEELSCREMINSILVYGESADENSRSFEQYLRPYFEKVRGSFRDGILTKGRVLQLIEEQKYDISRARINQNVHTDSEGLSYNSITWADE
jgi:hypothetical protein